jgi:ABC-type uncharacterized transport system auxiliary subunit
MRTRALILAALVLLAGCGRREALQPAQGASMPPKPAMAPATPTVAELLNPPPTARPERSDELLKRSEERRDDRFDLPPPD